MNTNKFKDQIIKVFWITIAWVIFSLFQFLIGYNTVMDLKCDLGVYIPLQTMPPIPEQSMPL